VIVALGLLSGLLTTGAWLPQLLRTWRRGRADDISYGYLTAFAAGVLGWLAYGLLAAQPAVVVANLVTFTLIAALAVLKTRPRRPRTERRDEPGDGGPEPPGRLAGQDVPVRHPAAAGLAEPQVDVRPASVGQRDDLGRAVI
jgi:MtN3 and saliva related transmembrane protein